MNKNSLKGMELRIKKKISVLLRKMLRRKIWMSKNLSQVNKKISDWEERGRTKNAGHEAKYAEYFQILLQLANDNKDILIKDGKIKTVKFPALGLIKWYFSKPTLKITDNDALIDWAEKDEDLSKKIISQDKYLHIEEDEDWEKVVKVLEEADLGHVIKTNKIVNRNVLDKLIVEESKKKPEERKLLNLPWISYKRDEYFSMELAEVKEETEVKILINEGIDV